MKSKLKLLALSASVLAGFAAAPAHAYVYGESTLAIQNLKLTITGATTGGPSNFTYTNDTSATLNGALDAHNSTCFGAPSPGINNCTGTAPRLGVTAANAPGSSATALRGNTDFSLKGPAGGLQFSNAASAIDTSELLGDTFTATRQITESQLQANGAASATTVIQSITGFAFTFTTLGGALTLDFGANPDLFASIVETANGFFSAQSNVSALFTLQQQTGGSSGATFTPRGAGASDCQTTGLTCVVTNDQETLNTTAGTTTVNTSQAISQNGATFSLFGISLSGLTAGTYRLTLAAGTSTQLSRLVVPEPGSLLLLGTGLAALALRHRRQKKQAA